MKKNYYLIGSTIGLGFALVMGYWIMKKSLWDMMFSFEKYNGFIPIATGVVTTLVVARICDRKITSEHFLVRGILFPSLIFLTGVIAGCLMNLVNYNSSYDFKSQVFDYFVKPFYWLTLFGLPACLVIGSAYFIAIHNKTTDPTRSKI